jgi:Flp pilus assembly protein TadG
MKKMLHDQKGVAAVEFAIVVPLLVVFVFGIIEFGLVFYNKAMITNASREAARAGIVFRDPSVTVAEIQTVVANYCNGMLVTFGGPTNATTTVPSGECVNHGDELVVRVAYQYDFLMIPDFLAAFFSGTMPGTVDITTTTRMRCE